MSVDDYGNKEIYDWCRRFSILLEDRVQDMLKNNLFSYDFPELCPDNNAPCGCDVERMKTVFFGETGRNYDEIIDNPTEKQLFKLIEFLYVHSSEPTKFRYHPFYNHTDIGEVSRPIGMKKFTNEINSLFHRLKVNFQLSSGKVIIMGNEIFEKMIDPNIFNTGDELTDKLLKDSIKFFKETDRNNKSLALEKLWDGWERIKTLEDNNKQIGIKKLLKNGIANEELRKYIENEAKNLTDIGNNFQIRHFEKDKISLNEEDLDYLYYRLFNLILRLLTGTKRISTH